MSGAQEGRARVSGEGRYAGVARRAAAAALILCALPAGAREISGSRSYSGELVVPKGETWRVRPGTAIRFRGGRWIVRGKLVMEGTAAAPVRIEGDDAFEGLDFRGGDGSSIAGAVIVGGRRGAVVTNTTVRFAGTRWEQVSVGLVVEPYGKAQVEGCAFASPVRVGILVKRGGAAEIAGTRFEGAGRAGLYVYGADDVSVRESRFAGNEVGLHAAMAGAHVTVSRSSFSGNRTALLAEKTAAPAVDRCEISGNVTGLHFTRRAEGTVSESRIADNQEGVVIEYSSYPVFRGNVFRTNRRHAVRLSHQSAEWEEAAGEADREFPGGGSAPFAAGPGARGDFRPGKQPGPPAPKAPPPGYVDFRGNDWGAGSASGPGAAAAVHDGADEPYFEYKGRRYRMDRVLLK